MTHNDSFHIAKNSKFQTYRINSGFTKGISNNGDLLWKMNIQNNGRAKLASLAMGFESIEVRNPKLTKQGLDQMIDTVLTAHWAPDAVREVCSNIINHFRKTYGQQKYQP